MKTNAKKVKSIENSSLDNVPTKAMLRQLNSTTQFKATIYETYKPKAKLNQHNHEKLSSPNSNATSAAPEVDLKRLKHEVFNYGKSGFNIKHKDDANIMMAIKLGARPPKNPYTNYKDLLAEKKLTRQAIIDQSAMMQLGKNVLGNASVTFKKLHKTGLTKKHNAGQITRNYGVVNPKIKKTKRK